MAMAMFAFFTIPWIKDRVIGRITAALGDLFNRAMHDHFRRNI